MTDPKEAAIRFEAVKVAMRQSKDGYVLILSIHPQEVPADLYTDLIGSRYVVAMVKLNDQDEPVMPKETEDAARAVAQAGMLCRNEKFQDWMVLMTYARERSEVSCVDGLHSILDITSRKDLRTNSRAREIFNTLIRQFERYMQSGR